MLSVWDWMDGWKITEILYAALSWELKWMWFLAQNDVILPELHPKIHRRRPGLSCLPAPCFSQGSFPRASGHGQRVAWGLANLPGTTWLSRILSYLCHPWENHTALFLTFPWFLSASFWGSEPSSACQSLHVNLFFFSGLTALPFPQPCCVDK